MVHKQQHRKKYMSRENSVYLVGFKQSRNSKQKRQIIRRSFKKNLFFRLETGQHPVDRQWPHQVDGFRAQQRRS